MPTMFGICLLILFFLKYLLAIESTVLNITIRDDNKTLTFCEDDCSKKLEIIGKGLSGYSNNLAIEVYDRNVTLSFMKNKNTNKFCNVTIENEMNQNKLTSLKFSCLTSPCKINATICKNNGSCIDNENSFQCNCASGYTGVYCEKKKLDDCEKMTVPYTDSKICINRKKTKVPCKCNATIDPNFYFSTTTLPPRTTLSWDQKLIWPLTPFFTYIVVSVECLFILILLIVIICMCCCNQQKCCHKKRRPKSLMDDSYLETSIQPRMKSTDHEMRMTHGGDSYKQSIINNPNAFHVTTEDLENRHNFKPIYDLREANENNSGNNNPNAADMSHDVNHNSHFMPHHPSEENDALHPMITDLGDDYPTNPGMSTFGRR